MLIEILFGWWLYKQLSRPDDKPKRRYASYSPVYTSLRDKVDEALRNFSLEDGEELKAISALKWITSDIATALSLVATRDDYEDWQYEIALSRANTQAGWVVMRLNSLVRSLERKGVSQPRFTQSDFALLNHQAQRLRAVVVEHYKIEDAADADALANLAASLAERTWEPRKRRP